MSRFLIRWQISHAQHCWSLEDGLIDAYAPALLTTPLSAIGTRAPVWLREATIRLAQWRAGRVARRYRHEMLGMENYLGEVLSFSGQRT